jgi:hypothetical protein
MNPLPAKHLRSWAVPLALLGICAAPCRAAPPATQLATQPADASLAALLPHIHVDLKHKRVSVDCQSLAVDKPLEFFCVTDGGNEYESVLRTPARPSNIHFALLMLGLKPGAPATFVPSKRVWLPPHGAPLRIFCRFVLHGKTIQVPAYRMMRSMTTKKEMPPTVWVFDGSRIMPNGVYAADMAGYVVSICNFDLTMIDVPALVSNSNETLQWEYNPALTPPRGAPVTLIIEPAPANSVTTQPTGVPADQFNPGPGLGGG